VVGVTKIQRGNANYWIEAVAEGGEDYYTKPGETPGQWLGGQAKALGLHGEIDRDSYAAALAGQNPATGEPLVHRPAPRTFTDSSGRERRLEGVLGFDVRFAAPKSVSLLYAVGSPEVRAAVIRAHEEAVAEGIAYLEQNACFVQRGRGGARTEPGAGLVAMAFRHRSSRAGDPALHTHVLVANMTRAASDGRWLSLASPRRRSPLYHHAKPAGYVFQAALRANLTRELGLEWQPVHNGYADLVAIERPVIEHFSRRRAEIVEALAEKGFDSAKAAEVAAYRTREAKEREVSPDMRRAEWIARAAEFELDSKSIAAQLEAVRPRQPRSIAAADLDAALAELEAHRSHFDRRDLLCALANQLPEGASATGLSQAVDDLLASARVIEIHSAADPLVPTFFTTPRLWDLEHRFIASASAGQNTGRVVVAESALAAGLERHRYLGSDQAEMVRRLTTGGERIVPVAALPGSGKTTALAAAREAWEAAGHPVIGVASARSASGELTDAGIPATSITALLIRAGEWEGREAQALAAGTVIVVDESSTASTPQLAALAELAELCDGKLVLVGDPRQIGAVGPGGLYGHLTRTLEPSVLTEIRRQREPTDRRVVELAHQGRGSDALDLLRASERLRIADTLPETLDALVLDWQRCFAAGEDAVMIARRSRDVAELNARARELLAAQRRAETPSVRAGGNDFGPGDHLITRVNTHHVSNRERWRVISIDADAGSLEVERIGGEGRRLRLDSDYLQRRTPNGEAAIQHAYALTAYATEAKTFDCAFVLLEEGMSREEFLVEISRARGATTAYGVAAVGLSDPELGPGSREIEDEAHELRAGSERPALDFPALEATTRERLVALSPHQVSSRRSELQRRLSAEDRRSPHRDRLDALEGRIAKTEARLHDLEAARAALELHRRPERQALARIEADLRLATRQAERLDDERQSLSVELAIEARRPRGLRSEERLELSLIDERLEALCRRQVAAERLRPSALVLDSLGERPTDLAQIALWNEGVHTIHAYRLRHGVGQDAGSPLGRRPGDRDRLREWRAAERGLTRIQQGLGLQELRSMERAAVSIEL
jgi:conjugative relaxase-like TrwC/TraI family protein